MEVGREKAEELVEFQSPIGWGLSCDDEGYADGWEWISRFNPLLVGV